jgi:hypothetical protein
LDSYEQFAFDVFSGTLLVGSFFLCRKAEYVRAKAA